MANIDDFPLKAGFTIKFYFDSKFAIQLFKGLVVNVIYGHFHSIFNTIFYDHAQIELIMLKSKTV